MSIDIWIIKNGHSIWGFAIGVVITMIYYRWRYYDFIVEASKE